MKSYREDNRIKPHILTAMVYIAVVLMLVFEIAGVRIYGNNGAFYLALPLYLYFLSYCCFVFAVQKAVYIMVRLRARRSQYLNAQNNMSRALKFFSFSAILFGFIIGATGYSVATKVLGAEKDFLLLVISGVSIAFLGPQGVFKGYLQGIGYTKPIAVSDVCIAFVSMATGITAAEFFYRYGLKANSLFHVDNLSAVYGSAGLLTGILAGSIVGFIFTLISYRLRRSEIGEFLKNSAPRFLDNKNDVYSGLKSLLLLYCTPALMGIVDECYYCISTRKSLEEIDYIPQYGMFFGKVSVLVILLSIICCIPFIKSWNRVMARFERDELEGARHRYKNLIRNFNLLTIPASIFFMSLPGTALMVFFGKTDKEETYLFMLGALFIYLCCFSILFSWLLNHMGKSMIIVLNIGIGWAVHIGLLIVFLSVLRLGVMGLMLDIIITFIVYDILAFLMIGKMLRYQKEYLRTYLLPLLSSAAAGFVVFFVNNLLINLIGEILTFLICIVVFWFLYMLLLVVFKGVSMEELYRIPLGNVFTGFAGKLQKDKYSED